MSPRSSVVTDRGRFRCMPSRSGTTAVDAGQRPLLSSARINSRNVRSPSPRTMKSTPSAGGSMRRAPATDRPHRPPPSRRDSATNERDDPARGAALERHHREADQLGSARASGAHRRPARTTARGPNRRWRPGDGDRRCPPATRAPPFGIRTASVGVCSKESGIDSKQNLHDAEIMNPLGLR